MMRGIDVSHYQAGLNVGGIAADFIIAKATGGVGYVDDQCDNFVQAAKAAGKKYGVYHYFSDGFNDGDPIAEANFFVDNCIGYVGEGMLILDWERGGNPDVNNVGKALAWLQHVEGRTGVKPVIYMSASLIRELDWSSVVANGNGLWCAAYVDNYTPIPNYAMDTNRDPNPNWDGNVNDVMWQFTSSGRIDGYGGNLDCDFFYGTREAWDAYARSANQSAPAPAPAPTPEPTPAPAPDPTPAPVEEPAPAPTPEEPAPTPAPVDPTPPLSTVDTTEPVMDTPSGGSTVIVSPTPTPTKSPAWEALKSVIRTAVFAAPGLLIAILTNNPSLAFGYGAPIMAVLKFVDKYLHENPNVSLKGLLPF